ncbi:hypothetical protein SAE01_07800 [Segetibacter aerophilus]|uniref:Uncharacterized protein n=1 Tax=Segetibacter aerophilus TaxID=670293 RepID=A0A512B8J8_9BACT|nr:hypothetical protein SAE01_07800 [Segetibacter aerophilus]
MWEILLQCPHEVSFERLSDIIDFEILSLQARFKCLSSFGIRKHQVQLTTKAK